MHTKCYCKSNLNSPCSEGNSEKVLNIEVQCKNDSASDEKEEYKSAQSNNGPSSDKEEKEYSVEIFYKVHFSRLPGGSKPFLFEFLVNSSADSRSTNFK